MPIRSKCGFYCTIDDLKKTGNDSSDFNRNLPWILINNFNISSYSGYEGRMSADYEYKKINRSISWLDKTGADFIIWKKDQNFKWISKYVDLNKSYQIKEKKMFL